MESHLKLQRAWTVARGLSSVRSTSSKLSSVVGLADDDLLVVFDRLSLFSLLVPRRVALVEPLLRLGLLSLLLLDVLNPLSIGEVLSLVGSGVLPAPLRVEAQGLEVFLLVLDVAFCAHQGLLELGLVGVVVDSVEFLVEVGWDFVNCGH